MLGLRQLKDTDGSRKGNRNVVGNFPGGGGCKGVIFLLTFSFSSPLQISISSMIYLVFFLVHSGCSGERQLCWPF